MTHAVASDKIAMSADVVNGASLDANGTSSMALNALAASCARVFGAACVDAISSITAKRRVLNGDKALGISFLGWLHFVLDPFFSSQAVFGLKNHELVKAKILQLSPSCPLICIGALQFILACAAVMRSLKSTLVRVTVASRGAYRLSSTNALGYFAGNCPYNSTE